MKTFIVSLLVLGASVVSCTKTETPQNTEPADYAETHEDLIQNPVTDSAAIDSTAVEAVSGEPLRKDSVQ